MEEECPRCGAIRSLDEMDWGCYSCGYMEGLDEDYDEDFDNMEDYWKDKGNNSDKEDKNG